MLALWISTTQLCFFSYYPYIVIPPFDFTPIRALSFGSVFTFIIHLWLIKLKQSSTLIKLRKSVRSCPADVATSRL